VRVQIIIDLEMQIWVHEETVVTMIEKGFKIICKVRVFAALMNTSLNQNTFVTLD
jgi:hypothetical protein